MPLKPALAAVIRKFQRLKPCPDTKRSLTRCINTLPVNGWLSADCRVLTASFPPVSSLTPLRDLHHTLLQHPDS